MANSIVDALRHWSFRRRQFSGDPAILDGMYKRADPWKVARREQARFAATNALIAAYCPNIESLLEIGCGEGAQTRHFMALAAHVTGIDLSSNAVERAKVAVPGPTYLEGALGDLLPALPRSRYDVATLCEVLIYGGGQAQRIADAQSCADHLLVTNFEPQAKVLAHLFGGEGWQELPAIASGRKRWRAYLWTSPSARNVANLNSDRLP